MILTFSSQVEAADAERRVIAGKIVPFEEVGNTSVGKVVFAKDSIEIGDPGKVKMLMQHQADRPIGRMQKFNKAEDGIYASFKISASMQGQDALILAGEQLIDGLSVGVDVNKSVQKKDYLYVTSATLKEVSLVETPAFSAAQVTKVAASESEAEDTNQTTESEAPVEDLATTPQEAKAEAATPTVEAARPVITAPLIQTSVRTPITSMAAYTEHKIKAALGNEESKLYIAAADDSFSTNPAFNPVQYLSEFVTNTRFGTPAIDACSQGTLPNSGMTISVPSLVTSVGGGNGVAPEVTVEAEGGAVQNTGMETQYLTATVSKYAGMNTLSVELLERSDPNFYAELTKQLEYAYLKRLDQTVLAALIQASANATNTTADLDGIVAFTSEAAQNIYKNTGFFASNYIANPAQWGFLIGAQDTTDRPVFNAVNPMNGGGNVGPTSIRGNVLGLDLYVDKNFTASTFDDDSAIILAPEAFTVYRSPQAFMSVNVVSNLQVQVAIYGYMATLAKMPNGIYKYKKT
ncbi:MAG: phage major capsid protein [Microbacteriaceae bacterium]|nr:phage major capsid protein [Microbacteriaceae bacterium]NBS61295.1 phage major capsid protein [Microbacteriaceae bacterium]